MKKFFLLFVKYMPAVQMAGMLFNNTLCFNDVNPTICYIIDFLIGNSVLFVAFMFICSYLFKFCIDCRLILAANFINITIAAIDSYHRLPISDRHLLGIYYVVAAIFIGIITIIHIKKK